MLILVSCTEALPQARVQLREGAGSSPFAGESDAERALVMTADPEAHTGLPLSHGVVVHTYKHTHRISGSLNRAKHRSRNHRVVGSIPGSGMSGGGWWQPCIKGIL